MRFARRLIRLIQNSPTYGLDRTNLVTGFSIGTAGLLLNGAVLMLLLPLMLDPDDGDFLAITEKLEFGQLLALILLGGATAFATLLIPLRLVSVFWGTRIGRYFDQIVLSGISPLRFVIGKAASQNLFLGLILFLLMPYFVLSVTLGGVDLVSFLAGVFLVWLYCMELALVMLWASLYLNELLAAVLVIGLFVVLAVLGCIPMPIQPFVVTPLPALMHPVYSSIPSLTGSIPTGLFPLFLSSVSAMTVVIGASLLAIFLGPLYGIIRENSTFGEVVRTGDSERKRRFRLRLHIQRPSEMAFFYENRSETLRRHEGLIRWGLQFVGLLAVFGVASLVVVSLCSSMLARRGAAPGSWWVYEFHAIYLWIHGCCLILAMFLFSHARNSMYLTIPISCGKRSEVSRLDTLAFLLCLVFSTTVAIATPFAFEKHVASPIGQSVFPALMYVTRGRPVDFVRVAVEGTLVISCAGLVAYALHRLACQLTWLRSVALLGTAGVYGVVICFLPLFIAMLCLEVPVLRRFELLTDWAPSLAMVSPLTVVMNLFNEMGSRFPRDGSTAPFFLTHALLLGLTLFTISRRGRLLRKEYLPGRPGEANG